LSKQSIEKKNQGNDFFKTDDFNCALSCYNSAISIMERCDFINDTEQIKPLMVQCGNNKVSTLVKLSKTYEGKEAAIKVLSVDPDNFKALIWRGTLALTQNEFEESLEALTNAQKVKPDSALVRKRIKELKDKQSEFKKKEKALFSGWMSRDKQNAATTTTTTTTTTTAATTSTTTSSSSSSAVETTQRDKQNSTKKEKNDENSNNNGNNAVDDQHHNEKKEERR